MNNIRIVNGSSPIIVVILTTVCVVLCCCVLGTATAFSPESSKERTTARPTSSDSPSAPAPIPSPVNACKVLVPCSSGGMAVTVMQVSVDNQLNSIISADEGKTFLLVEVVVENVNRDEGVYNPMYFGLKDGDGFEYRAEVFGTEKGLSSGELSAGERARGIVAFEIDATAEKFTLSFDPIVIGGGYEVIKIPLQ